MPTLVIAHRGASAEAPENTLRAFRRAIALQADAIELDVQLSHDGVPVVFHDEKLRRLTGHAGLLNALRWRDLKNLRVRASDQSIPRLTDVLALTCKRVVVQIELKRGTPVAPVLAAVKRARATAWVIFASFELDLMREAAALAPAIPRMLISEGRLSRVALASQLVACEAVGLSVSYRAVRSAGYVQFFQSQGFSVWSWTINNARVARRLAGWGIDGILGDNPALLKREV